MGKKTFRMEVRVHLSEQELAQMLIGPLGQFIASLPLHLLDQGGGSAMVENGPAELLRAVADGIDLSDKSNVEFAISINDFAPYPVLDVPDTLEGEVG